MSKLDGAYLRVQRATEHLANLEARIDAFAIAQKDSVPFKFDPDTQHLVIGSFEVKRDRSWDFWSILVGEITYNLRAALDYLVYELAILDSGVEQQGTQFPIEKTVEGFKRRKRSFLKGLSIKHIACIEALQPYNGVVWTQTLADLSNPDKHRHLTPTIDYEETTIHILKGIPGKFDGLPGHVYRTKGKAGESISDVHVYAHFAVSVTFSDGRPVIKTLRHLLLKVPKTLEAFQPEFQ